MLGGHGGVPPVAHVHDGLAVWRDVVKGSSVSLLCGSSLSPGGGLNEEVS